MLLHQPIIPPNVIFNPPGYKGSIDYRAISIFAALGFFLDKDTYFIEQKALKPATDYEIDDSGKIISEKTWWEWHYSPRDISLKQATEEFSVIFERIVSEQTNGTQIILPLSGGLDSRTLAAVLQGTDNVNSYTYEFSNGYPETKIGQSIASIMGFNFESLTVPQGYLWDEIESLADINGCYAEFTNPRQMAFIRDYGKMGNMFLLGHWGDVLFDNMGVPADLSFDEQIKLLIKKIVKKGGMELAGSLWQEWSLPGNFNEYLHEVVAGLMKKIKIDDANARLRAFKSIYWAPRWTSTNLKIFSSIRPVSLPYFHDDMCRFICTIPEKLLGGRQIQIEYLKMKSPALAALTWQAHKPFNLYNFHRNRLPWNLPGRIVNKTLNTVRSLTGKQLIQRNWELQFLGKENETSLEKWIIGNEAMNNLVSKKTRQHYLKQFREGDQVYWSHPLSMLLTLSAFSKSNS